MPIDKTEITLAACIVTVAAALSYVVVDQTYSRSYREFEEAAKEAVCIRHDQKVSFRNKIFELRKDESTSNRYYVYQGDRLVEVRTRSGSLGPYSLNNLDCKPH